MSWTTLVRLVLVLSILVVSCFYSISLGESTESEFITVTLRYIGELSLRATGRSVREVFGVVADRCNLTESEVHISIRYVLLTEILFKPGVGSKTMNVSLEHDNIEVLSNSHCLVEVVSRELKNWMTPIPSELNDIPLVMNLRGGVIELNRVKREGVVVGITRYGGIDIVQVKNDFVFNSVTSGSIIYGMDLYFEPVSKIPVHYVEVVSTRSNEGSLSFTIFVTIYEPNLDYSELFKDVIGRRAFEILVNATTTNTFATYKTYLAIIYAKEQGVNPDISIQVLDKTIQIVIEPQTTCLIVLGPLRDPIENSSVFMDYYTTRTVLGLQYIYYTPEPIKCRNISIQMPALITRQDNETSHPEVLPPPRYSPTIEANGYVVVVITMSVTMLLLYLFSWYVAKRITS